MSTWRDVAERDRCRDRLAAVKSCNRPSYRVACKRTVVNRNCLTRSEHTEMLSTPKGYLWTGARGLSYVLMRNCERTDGVRRRHAETANDAKAVWQEFVKQFLLIANGRLSPTMKTVLPKILMSKKIVSDPKWFNYPNTQAKLCSFFSNLNPECNSSKWKQDFLQSLSSLIFDYIVQVLYCDRITKKYKLLTSEILQNINNITREHVTLQSSPDSYVQGVQIFIANILSPWLGESTTDFCQDANADLLIKNNINDEFSEQKPNKRHAGNGSKKIHYRPSNLTPVMSTSHHGHKNKLKIIKKIIRVKSKSNVNQTDVDGTNEKKLFDSHVRENTEDKPSKANNGSKVQNGNRSKVKSAANGVKTKQNHNDAVDRTITIGSTEKEAKTKTVKFPKLNNHKNKNNSKIGSKSKLMSSDVTNGKSSSIRNRDESTERYNEKRLKTKHGRKRDLIGENGMPSNDKPLEPESTIEFDDTRALNENKAPDQTDDSTDVNDDRFENGRDDDDVIGTDQTNDGEMMSIKTALPKTSNGVIERDGVSRTDDKEKNGKAAAKRSRSKNRPRKNGDNPAAKRRVRKGENDKGGLTRAKSKSTATSKITGGKSNGVRNGDETKKRLNELKTQHDREGDTTGGDGGRPSNGREPVERKSQIEYDDSEETINSDRSSVGRVPDANEGGRDNGNATDTGTIAVGSDDRENNADDYAGNGNSVDIDDESGERTPGTSPGDGRVNADRSNCTRSYDDIRADRRFESCFSDETNAFLKRLSTNCNRRVTDTTTDKSGDIRDICYERFSNNAWTRFAANETANKASTDHKKRRNRNPGIVYRVCKRDGSNYSVRKTILPTRENGDPTFAADDPAVKAKLIMRKINEVEKC